MTKNFSLKEFDCKGNCKECKDGCDMPSDVYMNIIKFITRKLKPQVLYCKTQIPITVI